jgi:hypothetical protein
MIRDVFRSFAKAHYLKLIQFRSVQSENVLIGSHILEELKTQIQIKWAAISPEQAKECKLLDDNLFLDQYLYTAFPIILPFDLVSQVLFRSID